MKKNQESVKIIFDFIKENWWIFIGLFFALILSGLMEAYPVGLMQSAIDEIFAGGEFRKILTLIAFWYGCRLIKALAGFISGWLAGIAGANLGHRFRQILFERLRLASYVQLEKASSSETIVRTLNDVYDLGNLVTQPIVLVGQNLFIFIWSVFFLVRLDWVLFIACLPLGFIMLAAGQWVSGLNREVWKKQRNFYTRIVNCLIETVSACREITIFNLWSRQKKLFNNANNGVTRAQRSTAILISGLNNFTEALWPLATVVCLILGGYRVLTGNLTTGGMIAFMWYIQWVIHPISQIANYYAQIQKSFVAIERIQEMLDWFPPTFESRGNVIINSELRLENVSFGYGKEKEVIHNINFSVRKGEVVALVGETGCGKSTLLKVILGLVKPDSGKIFVDGKLIEPSDLCGSPSLAAVFQDPYLFNISITENVSLAVQTDSDEKESIIEQALQDAYVIPFLDDLPQKGNTIVGERSSRLSSGQRQRVALARALVKKPTLLILDEATSAVDTATEENIYRALFQKRDQFGCIIVSHRLVSVMGADKIYMMKDGRIIAYGTHKELMENCDEYKALYGAQISLEGDVNGYSRGVRCRYGC
ncbi:hypothetical protein BBF96_13925 [Anoxybacter fermentans]|uniref:ABC transporter ATP-binding protein n=1 Tax=Anoxybacter fermentans TaxID=1323375 RepID=A0A3Q9HSQ8_9FIRM|nr:ABC transporter ATP-binding protein [Anoxybacter fermentans]AZR74388.1 hypothetical protein BBF96_13925 [Anoxybacter fermentans]